MMRGQGYVELEGEEYELLEGDVVRIPPNVRHRFLNKSNDSIHVLFVLTPSLSNEALDNPRLMKGSSSIDKKSGKILSPTLPSRNDCCRYKLPPLTADTKCLKIPAETVDSKSTGTFAVRIFLAPTFICSVFLAAPSFICRVFLAAPSLIFLAVQAKYFFESFFIPTHFFSSANKIFVVKK